MDKRIRCERTGDGRFQCKVYDEESGGELADMEFERASDNSIVATRIDGEQQELESLSEFAKNHIRDEFG